tara:strand:- start:56828 stop:57349 length:522 start_codon:yes stop_codon:yes gene_type:complete
MKIERAGLVGGYFEEFRLPTEGEEAQSLVAVPDGIVVKTQTGDRPVPRALEDFLSPGSFTFTIPAGMTSLKYTLSGGAGGSGTGFWGGRYYVSYGGAGALVEGTLDVTGGQVVNVTVGAMGDRSDGYATVMEIDGRRIQALGGERGQGWGVNGDPALPLGGSDSNGYAMFDRG